jgi:hypothetical protein
MVVTITTPVMRRPCQAAVAVCQAVVEAAAVAAISTSTIFYSYNENSGRVPQEICT